VPVAATVAELATAGTLTQFAPPTVIIPSSGVVTTGVTSATTATLATSGGAVTASSDGDATATAIRNAEAVGHRRVLAGDAHGALSIEDLGRFEVSAKTHEDGRVDVNVRAERRDGAALLEHHAAELRADVRVEVPRASVAVHDASHGSAGGPSAEGGAHARSHGRESGTREERRADTRDRRGRSNDASVTAPAAVASSNGRPARVKIVL